MYFRLKQTIMSTKNEIIQEFETKSVTFAKGFNEAIIGFDEEENKMIYSREKA